MAKVDKETAGKELTELLTDWADGLDLPEDSEGAFGKSFEAVRDYIVAGKVLIQDGKAKVKHKDEWLEFGVPLGEAFMGMKEMDGAGLMAFAELMCGKQKGFLANEDARLAKKGVALAALFLHLP